MKNICTRSKNPGIKHAIEDVLIMKFPIMPSMNCMIIIYKQVDKNANDTLTNANDHID